MVRERRSKACAMRTAGESWQTIADALGYGSRGAACKDVGIALRESLTELKQTTDELREQSIARLEDMYRKAKAIFDAEHVKVSGGKVVRDSMEDPETGERLLDGYGKPTSNVPLKDAEPKLRALDRMLRIEQQLAVLQGTAAPTKVEQSGSVNYVIEGVDMEKLK